MSTIKTCIICAPIVSKNLVWQEDSFCQSYVAPMANAFKLYMHCILSTMTCISRNISYLILLKVSFSFSSQVQKCVPPTPAGISQLPHFWWHCPPPPCLFSIKIVKLVKWQSSKASLFFCSFSLVLTVEETVPTTVL